LKIKIKNGVDVVKAASGPGGGGPEAARTADGVSHEGEGWQGQVGNEAETALVGVLL
jgi:hypothetical protein